VTAIGDRPKPELCFLPDGWGERSCPSSATAIHSVSGCGSNTQPFKWEADTFHREMPPHIECLLVGGGGTNFIVRRLGVRSGRLRHSWVTCNVIGDHSILECLFDKHFKRGATPTLWFHRRYFINAIPSCKRYMVLCETNRQILYT